MKEEKKTKKKLRLNGKQIFNIVFWAIIVILFATWITDFIMIKQEKEPKFCISKKTHECDEGTIEQCTGLGYKVYNYSCANKNAVEFGPFFISIEE